LTLIKPNGQKYKFIYIEFKTLSIKMILLENNVFNFKRKKLIL